jgi:hypothetical protein
MTCGCYFQQVLPQFLVRVLLVTCLGMPCNSINTHFILASCFYWHLPYTPSAFTHTVQAMFLMAWRLTKLAEAGSMSHEQASLVKAWNTLRGREVRGGPGCRAAACMFQILQRAC